MLEGEREREREKVGARGEEVGNVANFKVSVSKWLHKIETRPIARKKNKSGKADGNKQHSLHAMTFAEIFYYVTKNTANGTGTIKVKRK